MEWRAFGFGKIGSGGEGRRALFDWIWWARAGEGCGRSRESVLRLLLLLLVESTARRRVKGMPGELGANARLRGMESAAWFGGRALICLCNVAVMP